MNFRVVLSNPLDPVSKASGTIAKSIQTSLPLASIQRTLSNRAPSNDSLPSGVTLSFLESQIATSCFLKSSVEFKYWLLATVNHLLEKGNDD